MIYVIATIRVKPGQRQAFLDEFHHVVSHVLAEQGCIEYGPTVDLETDIPNHVPTDENEIIIVERWENLESLQAHLKAPHMLRDREAVADLVAGPAKLQILEPT